MVNTRSKAKTSADGKTVPTKAKGASLSASNKAKAKKQTQATKKAQREAADRVKFEKEATAAVAASKKQDEEAVSKGIRIEVKLDGKIQELLGGRKYCFK